MSLSTVLCGTVFIDVETGSEVELPLVGSDVYFSHPSTRVICVEAITQDGELFSWSEGEKVPLTLFKWILAGWTFVAHGVVFERLAFERILVPRHGFPMPDHWGCSMMRARYNGLPAALEYAASALGLPIEKDMAGARLMRTMCRPRLVDGERRWWHLDDPEKLQRLKAYCLQDCKVSQAVWRFTRTPPPAQMEQYALVARMNKRGVRVDIEFARAAVNLAVSAKANIDMQMRIVTRSVVDSASKVTLLKQWIADFDIDLASLDKRDVQRFLARPLEDIPFQVRDAIKLRMESAKSSVSKYQAMINRANAQQRVEDAHVWHGAGTGRLSSQGLQAQNFRREIHPNAEWVIDDIKRGGPELYDNIHKVKEPLELLSTLLRPTIMAEPGRELVGGDLSQIEARVLAWIAGDQRILALFREGQDVYRYIAADLLGCSVNVVTDPQRQAGKVCDLAFGFGGSVGALQAMARQYNMPAFDDVTARRLVDTWRMRRPLYTNFWKVIEYAAKAALLHPGKPWRVAGPVDIDFASDGTHLFLRLPSGRLITYRDAAIEDWEVPWGGTAPQIRANGVNSMTRRFERYTLSRVILVENVVQGIAADVMFAGLDECDKSDYEPVLSVHDELVCEPPPALLQEAKERLGWLMTMPLAWTGDLPLAAKTWSAKRYLKQ
jgi:DNA polymerase